MNGSLHIERIHRVTPAQREGLQTFGTSFGHAFPSTFPVDLAYVDGDLKGWYAVHEHAVVYPALHPKKTSPRDFYRLFSHLLSVYRQRYGDPWLVTDLEYPTGGVTPQTLRRFGVVPLPKAVYQIAPTP